MKKFSIIAGLAASLMLSGCAQRVADFTLASTKNVNLNNGDFVKGERVEGIDRQCVFLVPLGIPNVKEATDNAIETDPCAVALSNLTAESETFAFIFGYIQYRIEGDLVIDKTLDGCEAQS